jgi:geranylgeranyl diphosphate synthase type I
VTTLHTTEGAGTAARPAAEVLAAGRALTGPALRAAVERMPESMRRVAGYHFGWLDAEGTPDGGDSGKAIRPALVLLCAEAVGADPPVGVPAAVAVELVHNFSLLHDDVMDRDVTRRHRPTAWTVFGNGPAILAGDALLAQAFDELAASGPAGPGATRMLSGAVLDLLDGQAADLEFEQREDVGVAECERMASGKTGALLGAACALGALYGGASAERIDHYGRFGRDIGLAFQHADDLLGIWGDPATTGKPVYSDLQNRKKSLPVVATMTSATPAGKEFAELYRSTEPLTEAELARAAELVDAGGGKAWSQARADTLFERGLDHLASASPARRAAGELNTLARLAVRRER